MSVPLKIDNRNYNDIVEQTVKLAQHYTAQEKSESVSNQLEYLRDRTLAEDIKDADSKIVAKSGTLIDQKLSEEIVKVTSKEKINVKVKGWSKPENPDAGLALIRIFGRMTATAIDRLNRVPDKNFLAFLDLIGTQIQPPQPARVPLTFSLAEGSPIDAFVPAGTQVAAPPTEGQAEEVVFETERDLVVTTTQLKAAIVRQPNQHKLDRYSDSTLRATGEQNLVFPAFEAETPIEHFLYLACDNLTSLPGEKAVTLTFLSTQVAKLQQLFSEWRYWDGKTWQTLNSQPTQPIALGSLEVTIQALPAIEPQTVNAIEARWLRVSWDGSQQDMTALPTIDRIQAQASVNVNQNPIAPVSCLFNTSPIDLSKDFYPFGEQPRFNDTFYIAHELSQPATVTIAITLSDGIPVRTDGGVQLAWETWNGSKWEDLSLSSDSSQTASRFLGSGNVKLTLPATVAPTEINGESHYWLRVRILKGNYGTSAEANQSPVFATLSELAQANQNRLKVSSVRGFIEGDAIQILSATPVNATVSSIEFATKTLILATNLTAQQNAGTLVQVTSTTSGIQPPSVKSLTYTYSSKPPLTACLTYNDFKYDDFTDNIRSWVHSESARFTPFVRNPEPNPALYLGFDRPFANRPIALYFQVESPQPWEVAIGTNSGDREPVRLVWEYASSNTSDWVRLGVEDETQAFADRGLIRFIAPPDLAKRTEFGVEFYWLRVRWEAGEFRVKPFLRRVLTNTIWASQTNAIAGELLGSGNGNPQQVVRTAQVPILLGQRLEVREREMPSPEEQAAIERQEGKDALTVIPAGEGETQDIEAVWVRWHEVTDFYESGPRDRHYTVDRLTGAIYFGDGQNGAMPPQGRNNIRLSYRTGGGQHGNLPDRTVTQLKTTVPYVDGVTNLEAAGGGGDRESIARVQERGPKILRHGGKAVTVQDFEDLAYEASTEIARVKAIVPEFDPLDPKLWIDPSPVNPKLSEQVSEHGKVKVVDRGKVTLLIVPYSSAAQPTPSLALIDRVRDYIRSRCSPTVDLLVAAPQWQQVSVTTELVPTSLDVADAVRIAARSRLEQFLHPLTGGPEGRGWAFGREPHLSDIYALLESIAGIDRIRSLQIGDGRSETPNKSSRNDRFLIYSGKHQIDLI
jgi:Baseplate J-like protein